MRRNGCGPPPATRASDGYFFLVTIGLNPVVHAQEGETGLLESGAYEVPRRMNCRVGDTLQRKRRGNSMPGDDEGIV
jgi:hypothetical protein